MCVHVIYMFTEKFFHTLYDVTEKAELFYAVMS